MSLSVALTERSGKQCELCQSTENLTVYDVPPHDADIDNCIVVCQTCYEQLNGDKALDAEHWRCLGTSMWSAVPAVQVVAYRLLCALSEESWAQDNLDMLYLEEAVQSWADEGLIDQGLTNQDEQPATLDANGTVLQAGDSVTLIKDLPVKGAGFTAKRGTAVRNISLTDNPEHIEGRVNGQRIVLVSRFLKKM